MKSFTLHNELLSIKEDFDGPSNGINLVCFFKFQTLVCC
jgi:hypothetical protein